MGLRHVLADGEPAPADVGLNDPNALPLPTISCANFGQSAEFQGTLFNINQPLSLKPPEAGS
jgi:hypothetical protein